MLEDVHDDLSVKVECSDENNDWRFELNKKIKYIIVDDDDLIIIV